MRDRVLRWFSARRRPAAVDDVAARDRQQSLVDQDRRMRGGPDLKTAQQSPAPYSNDKMGGGGF